MLLIFVRTSRAAQSPALEDLETATEAVGIDEVGKTLAYLTMIVNSDNAEQSPI